MSIYRIWKKITSLVWHYTVFQNPRNIYKINHISINVKNDFCKCRSHSLITMQWVEGRGESLQKNRAKAHTTLWTSGLKHTWRQFNSRVFGYFHQKRPTPLFVNQVFCHSQQKYSNTIIWKFYTQSNYKLSMMK